MALPSKTRSGLMPLHSWHNNLPVRAIPVWISSQISNTTHGSTYGGNPLGCAVAIRALEVVQEENMVERSEKLGHLFRDGLLAIQSPIIQTVRGKGVDSNTYQQTLLLHQHTQIPSGMSIRLRLINDDGIEQTRLAPPLVITEEEIQKALDIIKEAVTDLPNLKGASEDKVIPPPLKLVSNGNLN
jgi:ornithine--oxo-acid transaminase